MATLKANGDCLVEMILHRTTTDGADGDEMRLMERKTYRAMSSGYTLKKRDVFCDYGLGSETKWHTGVWKRCGKIKAALLADRAALFEGFQAWADQLREKGWDVELS